MAVSKVVYGTTVLVDLTADTVSAEALLQGYTAHDKTGAQVTGTATGGGQTYYTSSAAPDDAVGVNGDLFFVVGS